MADILVRQATLNNTFSLEDFAGNGTVVADVEAYLVAQNPGNTAASAPAAASSTTPR